MVCSWVSFCLLGQIFTAASCTCTHSFKKASYFMVHLAVLEFSLVSHEPHQRMELSGLILRFKKQTKTIIIMQRQVRAHAWEYNIISILPVQLINKNDIVSFFSDIFFIKMKFLMVRSFVFNQILHKRIWPNGTEPILGFTNFIREVVPDVSCCRRTVWDKISASNWTLGWWIYAMKINQPIKR